MSKQKWAKEWLTVGILAFFRQDSEHTDQTAVQYKHNLYVHWETEKKKNVTFFYVNSVEPNQQYLQGFPGSSDGKESTCNAGDQVLSLGQEDPLEEGMATHSSILACRIP